ncbi:MAG: hypothetical protein WBX11_09630 [Thiobacillaceae bacterium]
MTFNKDSVDPFHAASETYAAVSAAATDICTAAESVTWKGADDKSFSPKKFGILVDSDLNAITAYQFTSWSLTHLAQDFEHAMANYDDARKRYLDAIKQPVQKLFLPGLATVAGVLSVGLDVAKWFRTNLEVHPETPSVTDQDLADAIFSCMDPTKVTYPSAERAKAITSWDNSSTKALLEKVDGLSSQANRDVIEGKSYEDPGKGKEGKSEFDALQSVVTTLDALGTHYKDLMGSLIATDATTKAPLLLTVLQGETTSKSLLDVDALLSARRLTVAGFSVKSESIWRSDQLFASGGVIVSYQITDKNGNLKKVGIVTKEGKLHRVDLKP